jgi:hypothetical protein
MKTASVREIRNTFPAVLKLVRNGHTVAITSHRKVVATLSPPPKATKTARKPWADLDEHFAQVLARPTLPVTGAELIAGDRDRY